MKKSRVIKLLTGRGELREQLVFKNIICIIIILAGIVIWLSKALDIEYFKNLTQEANAVLDGFGSVFIIVGIVRIIKNMRILNNESNLKEYEIRIKDERNISVQRLALSTTAIVCIWIGFIVSIIYLPYNVVVTYTLLHSICVLLVVYLIFSFIFNRIM